MVLEFFPLQCASSLGWWWWCCFLVWVSWWGEMKQKQHFLQVGFLCLLFPWKCLIGLVLPRNELNGCDCLCYLLLRKDKFGIFVKKYVPRKVIIKIQVENYIYIKIWLKYTHNLKFFTLLSYHWLAYTSFTHWLITLKSHILTFN